MSGSNGGKPLRCNVGCGMSPTEGWRNFDNSLSLRLARVPGLPKLLARVGLIGAEQHAYMRFARENRLEFGDAVAGLPLEAGSAAAVYSSHMLEHLDEDEAAAFLAEARRVLRGGGILRVAVPDLAKILASYSASGDADRFMASTFLTQRRPKGVLARLRALVVGSRHHHWMYDGASLSKAFLRAGLVDVRICPAGETGIEDPGGLDLREREDESVYVEGANP